MRASGQSAPHVAAAIPGRIRLQWHGARHDPDLLRRLADRLGRIHAVRETSVVPAANSVILRYPAGERDLAAVRREALEAGRSVSGQALGPAPSPEPPRAAGGSRSPAEIAVLEDHPGRVRLRIDRLKGRSEGWAYLEYRLGGERAIDRVQAGVDAATILISYDAAAQDTRRIIRRVNQLLPRALKRQPGHAEIARLRDIPARSPAKLNPLVLPTAAIVLAALDPFPAAIAVGVLAVAAMPIAGRAAEGVRARQFNVDQLDAANVGILAVQGNLLAASGVAWLVGLAELIRGKVLRSARAAARQGVARSPLRLDLAHLVENAPLSDTRLQSDAATTADRMAWPSAALGALQLALRQDGQGWAAVGDAIGMTKPRSDFASTIRFAPPAAVLRALAGALSDGILIRSGKALEKLARVDTILLDAPVAHPLAEALCRRGVTEIAVIDHGRVRSLVGRELQPALPPGEGSGAGLPRSGAAAFVEQRRAQKRVVAVVAGDHPDPDVLAEADVVLAVDPEQRLAGGDWIDVLLMDADPRLLLAAIDRSRRATRILKQDLAIAGTGSAANLATALLGASPPVASQLITTGVIALAGLNASRAGGN